MSIFLTIVHIIVCFMLILVILLQAGRGQGLTGASFGSGNVQSLLGTRAADFLTKATTVAAICFLFTCLGLDYLEVRRSRSLLEVSGKSAPIDLDQIKEALEKVKKVQDEQAERVELVRDEEAAQAESISPDLAEAVVPEPPPVGNDQEVSGPVGP
jgi:preprotein translocase subunit SecG